MEEDDSFVATLIAIDQSIDAFGLDHNRDRYIPPVRDRFYPSPDLNADTPPGSSDEDTDDEGGTDQQESNTEDDFHAYDHMHRIRLDFNKPPKNEERGFVFGTDPTQCDIILARPGQIRGISRAHFSIKFGKDKIVLEDFSKWGTTVSYDNQAKNEVRRNFKWILDLRKRGGNFWNVEIHVPNRGGTFFKFKPGIHSSAAREKKHTEGEGRVSDAQGGLSLTEPPTFDANGNSSQLGDAQVVDLFDPKQNPIYLSEKVIGAGSYGIVDVVRDVSTGALFARKLFFKPSGNCDMLERERKHAKWKKKVNQEVRILREHPHKHIVPILGYHENPEPTLLMPYYSIGSLRVIEGDINEDDIISILYQTLVTLEYLHSRKVVHRDLKPENILVETRKPLQIKLADFGFAKDNSELVTLAGSPKYAAPEISLEERYTSSVDIWSLGVVILHFACDLSTSSQKIRQKKYKSHGFSLSWPKEIIRVANSLEPGPLADLICEMLKLKPDERLSASKCLKNGRKSGLFARCESNGQIHADMPQDTPDGKPDTATRKSNKRSMDSLSETEGRCNKRTRLLSRECLDPQIVTGLGLGTPSDSITIDHSNAAEDLSSTVRGNFLDTEHSISVTIGYQQPFPDYSAPAELSADFRPSLSKSDIIDTSPTIRRDSGVGLPTEIPDGSLDQINSFPRKPTEQQRLELLDNLSLDATLPYLSLPDKACQDQEISSSLTENDTAGMGIPGCPYIQQGLRLQTVSIDDSVTIGMNGTTDQDRSNS
ncbi:hypothetical protein FQN57_002854 [Myotisia sp. PD_48]|nr:hypothetical protein FQN57_002854 [Myotisia sp. PD_48]